MKLEKENKLIGNKFNIIGFWDKPQSRWRATKTCVIHYGTILVPKKDKNGEYEPGVLWCPECGTSYLEKDTATEEHVKSMFGPSSNQSRIIQVKKKRKFYDSHGMR